MSFFTNSSGLEYNVCKTKMRRLTLASMAVKEEIIPFSSLREELQLSHEELEDFIFTCECGRLEVGVVVVWWQIYKAVVCDD